MWEPVALAGFALVLLTAIIGLVALPIYQVLYDKKYRDRKI